MKKYTKILIVGAGPMAIEYAKVLKAQKSEFITVGNTKKGANNFKKDIKFLKIELEVTNEDELINYLQQNI